MSIQKAQVRRFYELVWDAHDPRAMPSILHSEFTFRGSLGQTARRHAAFWAYVDRVHDGLANYHCVIQELMEEGSKVFARMNFAGVHVGEFLGFPASGEALNWDGCAIFTFAQTLVTDIWVLGDLKALYDQLELYAEQHV